MVPKKKEKTLNFKTLIILKKLRRDYTYSSHVMIA